MVFRTYCSGPYDEIQVTVIYLVGIIEIRVFEATVTFYGDQLTT